MKLILELTNLCNFSCIHCLREEGHGGSFLPMEIIDKVLRESAVYQSFDLVVFTGGEPTLHPRFAEIVERVATAGPDVAFVTNGWRFKDTFREIEPLKGHIRHINFSLDGATEETHDRLRRRQGSYRRLMQAISLCHFHGVPAQINMVVTSANRGEIEAMALLASRLGCQALGYGHCQPTPEALAAGLVPGTRERRRIEAEIAALQQTFQMSILLAGDHYDESLFSLCPQLAMRELNVDYRGNLTACCMLSSFRGGVPDTDVVADLSRVSLFEGHRRLTEKIATILREKVDRVEVGASSEADHFQCSHCLEHYRKVPDIASCLSQEPRKGLPTAARAGGG